MKSFYREAIRNATIVTIRGKLSFSFILLVLVIIGNSLFLSSFYLKITSITEENYILEQTFRHVFESSILLRDFLSTHTERSAQQWRATHTRITLKLEQLAGFPPSTISDELIHRRMKVNNDILGSLFDKFITEHEASGSWDNEAVLVLERSLSMRASTMLADAYKLSAINNAYIANERQAFILVLSISMLESILVILFIVAVTRRIFYSLKILRRGSELIGELGFLPQIVLMGNDEFTELSNSINAMSRRIEGYNHELRESKESALLLFESSPQPLWVYDTASLKFLAVNDRAIELYGFSRDEFSAMTLLDVRAIEDIPTLLLEMSVLDRGESVGEWRHKKKDGTFIDVLINSAPINFRNTPARIALVQDITKFKHAEAALQNQRQSLRNILWATDVGTWEWNVQTGETRFNKRWAELIGYALDEISPTTIDTWMTFVHPDDLALSGELLRCHFSGELDHYACEKRMRHKEGQWIWVLDRGKVITRTADGQPLWMAGTHTDITERKNAEAQIVANTQLLEIQAKQLETVNAELKQFAYAASHDLRQPLRMVISFLNLVAKKLGSDIDDEMREYIGFAVNGAKRMDAMIVSLLEYSRTGQSAKPFEPYSLSEAVDESLFNLRLAIEDAKAEVEVGENLPTIMGEEIELVRLFQNLIGNAVKYHRPNSAVKISVGWRDDDSEWVVWVKDNGIGIAANSLERVFKVFERLVNQDQYEGSGIGLAVCKKIAEHHGGRIWVLSVEGEGSTFLVAFPKTAL